MRIRASVLTPILAMFTVMAIVATGVALGQMRQGDANATLLDSMQSFATTAGTEATVVAAVELPETGAESVEPPITVSVELVQPLPAVSATSAGSYATAATPATTRPTTPHTTPATTPTTTPATTPPTAEAGDDGAGSDQNDQPSIHPAGSADDEGYGSSPTGMEYD
jgi:hypothetical protein